jgi:hypothetical protein
MMIHDRHTTRIVTAVVHPPRMASHTSEHRELIGLSQRLAVSTAAADIENPVPRARITMGGGASNEIVPRMKGYRRIYGRAQKDLLNYYVNKGWKPLEGSSEFLFSDHADIEIVFDAEPNPNAVKRGAHLLMRPEGRWDRPGILDQSAIRSARKPATQKRHA